VKKLWLTAPLELWNAPRVYYNRRCGLCMEPSASVFGN